MENQHRFGFVKILLGKDIALRHPPTLDGIIGGILWEKTKDPVLSPRCDMITREKGVPLASRIFLLGDINQDTLDIFQSIPNNMARNFGFGRLPWKLRGGKLTSKGNLTSTYTTFNPTGGIGFFVHGDLEEIRRLILWSGAICSARSGGNGNVKAVEITPLDCHPHLAVCVAGGAIRPIPTDLAEYFGAELEGANVFPSYFKSPYVPKVAKANGITPVECVLPDADMLWAANDFDLLDAVA